MTTEATELPPEPLAENPEIRDEIADILPENNDSSRAAADELRQRFALHGFELADEVQLAEVPGNVLAALMQALAAQPGPRPSESERREQLAERIAHSQRLPRGVRERLASVLESVRFDDIGRDEPALRLSDAVALLEETLPPQLLLTPHELDAANHPRGESFFSGDARSLSDDDARRIAADQLMRTGYRRAQPKV